MVRISTLLARRGLGKSPEPNFYHVAVAGTIDYDLGEEQFSRQQLGHKMISGRNIQSFQNPIPQLRSVQGWEQVPIRAIADPLCLINDYYPKRIVTFPAYFRQGFKSASPLIFLRQTAANLLRLAADHLPKGMRIAVFDGWRPTALQQELFSNYVSKLERENPVLSDSELKDLAGSYVTPPTTNATSPAPHLTGGAVDLSLCDDRSRLLPMGTDFDYFGPEAATRYFEESLKDKGLDGMDAPLLNRRILYHALAEQGFTNYSREWWHFDYGNQFWGRITGQPALYGGIERADGVSSQQLG